MSADVEGLAPAPAQSEVEMLPPTDALELALHESFWWFFQSHHHEAVLRTLSAPDAMRALIRAVCRPTESGLGLGAPAGGDGGVFADGPVKYVNMNPGHGASTFLVTAGAGSEQHRLAFTACQILLTPQLVPVLLADDALLAELFRFVALPPPLPTVRAGYFTNLTYQLLDAEPERMAAFAAQGALAQLIAHAENDSVRRLLCHRIDEVVPIGSASTATASTRWLGLLSGGPMLPLLKAEGADPSALLLDHLEQLPAAAPAHAAVTAMMAEVCESWGACAQTHGGSSAEAAVAREHLQAWHGERAAAALLAPLRVDEGGDAEGAKAMLPVLIEMVGLDGSGVGRWGSSALRRQLRRSLPVLAGWLRPASEGPGRVGALRFGVARLLAALCAVEDFDEDCDALVASGALSAMVEALFGFPTASVLHATLAGAMRRLMRRRDSGTACLLGEEGGLMAALARACAERGEAQNARPPPQYYGHVDSLVSLVQECRSIVGQQPAFQVLVRAHAAPVPEPREVTAVLRELPGGR